MSTQETLQYLHTLSTKLNDDGADFESIEMLKEADLCYHRSRVIEDAICVIDDLLAESTNN